MSGVTNIIRAKILLNPSNPKEFSSTPFNIIIEGSTFSSRTKDTLRSLLYSIYVQGGVILFESRSILTLFLRIDGGVDSNSNMIDEATVINETATALLNAGISLRFIPIAVSIKEKKDTTDFNHHNALVVFSMQDLLNKSHSCQPIYLNTRQSNNPTTSTSISTFTINDVKELIKSARNESIDLLHSYRNGEMFPKEILMKQQL